MIYFLGFMVVLVWGIIIYRIITAARGNDNISPPTAFGKISKDAYNDFDVTDDTTHLLLNYRDPFGLVRQKDTTDAVKRRNSIEKPSLPLTPTAFNWGFIKYSGYILNPDSKKLITLVTVNGQNLTLTDGETKAKVKLIRNFRDSIEVGFGGKIKFIALK